MVLILLLVIMQVEIIELELTIPHLDLKLVCTLLLLVIHLLDNKLVKAEQLLLRLVQVEIILLWDIKLLMR